MISNYIESDAAITKLAKLFPAAFSVYEQRRRPLKIGIHHDLAGVMPESELSMALGMYTKNTGYMRNMREGVGRIDLSGNPVGVVSAEHAAGAARWVKARMRRKLEAVRERKLEAAHKSYTEAWATVDKLVELYPLAFFKKGHKRRPLKLDLIKDIIGMPEVANAFAVLHPIVWVS
jgi:sRNA-binding protein